MAKIKIAIVAGGKSGEHEVSLVSAWNIWNGLDRKKYDIVLVGIDQEGQWRFGKDEKFWMSHGDVKKTKINSKAEKIAAVNKNGKAYLIDLKNGKNIFQVDVFFPITHGTFGEDGCLQGFFEILGAAYVGPGVLASAVGMDKDFAKRLMDKAGIINARGYVLENKKTKPDKINEIIKNIGFPIFVKPANLGSSVGISKVKNKSDLQAAVKKAFQYDNKIILEEAITGREIECSVMGNKKIKISVPGEIKIKSDFYSYEAKYVNENDAVPESKAKLSEKQEKRIKETAGLVYRTLGCEGMARVDFFLTESEKLYVNEINTLPGFTSVSMFPKMFEQSGIRYSKLLDMLIGFAVERKINQDKLKRTNN